MIVLNFSRPLTPEQAAQIKALSGKERKPRIIDVSAPLESAAQVIEAMESLSLDAFQWNAVIVVSLPVSPAAAATIMAWLHGRTGYFPPFLRLVGEEVVEICRPQDVRNAARNPI